MYWGPPTPRCLSPRRSRAGTACLGGSVPAQRGWERGARSVARAAVPGFQGEPQTELRGPATAASFPHPAVAVLPVPVPTQPHGAAEPGARPWGPSPTAPRYPASSAGERGVGAGLLAVAEPPGTGSPRSPALPGAARTLGTGAQTPRTPRGASRAAPCAAGIGKCVALELARRNARTILACRSRERGQAAVEEIRAATGNPAVLLRLLDTSSLASVRAFARAVLQEEKRLDVLVNNAGVTGTHRGGSRCPSRRGGRCPQPHSVLHSPPRAALRRHAGGAGTNLRHQLPGPLPADQPAAG